MQDENDSLAGLDLDAWQPPPPPAGLADAVIARMRQPAAASAVEPSEHRSRRLGWIAGIALAAAAAAALATWGMSRSPGHGRGDVIAARPQHLDLDGSTADLDAGAEVRWQRDGGRITAQQTRGNVQWTIQEGDTLVLAPGGPGATATIEASGASLRVEARMNLSDMRVLGASSLTAAAVALVSVTVYQGHVRATSGGQTVRLEPGAAVELRPAALPAPKQAPDPSLVGASPVDVTALEARLAAAETRIRELTEDLPVKDQVTIVLEPRNVPPSVLEANRVQGEKIIEPDAASRIELALAGIRKIVGTFKLCVDEGGRVSSVEPLKSTGLDRYDRTIVEGMHGWKFDPVELDGEVGPVCTAVTFRYELSTAAPPPQEPKRSPRTVHQAPPTRAASTCGGINIEDLMMQAQNQFIAGYEKQALLLMRKALACTQDVRMYRLAATYACAGRDLATAREYIQKIPPQYRAAIEQRCQQEGINLRGR